MKFDQIRRVRKAAHVTQEELAKRIGVNRALISKYETGIIEPSVSQLQKIASVLGVPMMELLDLEEGAERIKRDENLIRKLSYEFDIPAEIIRRRAANKSSHTEIDALRKLVKAGSILDESKVSLQNDEPVQGVKLNKAKMLGRRKKRSQGRSCTGSWSCLKPCRMTSLRLFMISLRLC